GRGARRADPTLTAGRMILISIVLGAWISQAGAAGAPSDHDHGGSTAAAGAATQGTARTPAPARAPASARGAAASGNLVHFKSGAETIDAYLSVPKGEGPHPGILVIHEWWGLNPQIKSVANDLAAKGYVALAPDLYRGKVTDDPSQAMELLRAL